MVLCGISTSFPVLFPSRGKVAHALLTRPPLEHLCASTPMSPLDLHVLSTPPAFVLSQDQTLAFNPFISTGSPARCILIRNYCLFVCVISVLYRFQGSVPAPSALRPREQACSYYHVPKTLSTLFFTFLHLFSLLFRFANILPPPASLRSVFERTFPPFNKVDRSGFGRSHHAGRNGVRSASRAAATSAGKSAAGRRRAMRAQVRET